MLTGTGEFFEGALIEGVAQFADDRVEFVETEQSPMAQAGQNPAFHHEHATFRFGFITRFSDTRGDHRDAIMGG